MEGTLGLGRQLLRFRVATVGAVITAMSVVVVGLAGPSSAAATAASASTQTGDDSYKPRTIVTTDPELDDLNSLIRLLLYSNEVQIEGLIYASGQHHYAGNPQTGTAAHRWKAGQSHIEDALDAYA